MTPGVESWRNRNTNPKWRLSWGGPQQSLTYMRQCLSMIITWMAKVFHAMWHACQFRAGSVSPTLQNCLEFWEVLSDTNPETRNSRQNHLMRGRKPEKKTYKLQLGSKSLAWSPLTPTWCNKYSILCPFFQAPSPPSYRPFKVLQHLATRLVGTAIEVEGGCQSPHHLSRKATSSNRQLQAGSDQSPNCPSVSHGGKPSQHMCLHMCVCVRVCGLYVCVIIRAYKKNIDI